MKVKTVWIQDLKTETERKEFAEFVLSSKKVLDKLKEICYNNIKSGEKVTEKDFETPNWDYKAAFRAGKSAALREIIEILTVDKD